MTSDPARIARQRTTLITTVVGLIAAGIGALLLLLGNTLLAPSTVWRELVTQLGSILIASVAIVLFWELHGKRVFFTETWAQARLASDVRSAGLESITRDFLHGVSWPTLVRDAREIDIFFLYGHSWRGAYGRDLRLRAADARKQLRLILPNPDDTKLMGELANRLQCTSDEAAERVRACVREFQDFFTANPRCLAIWYHSRSPVYSFYRFDDVAVVAFFQHRPQRGAVPTLVCRRGGSMFEFVEEELKALTEGSSALATKCGSKTD